jgi:dimethylhistidine N-methyltransferase
MDYKILDSIKNQEENALKEQFALDVLTGFMSKNKFIPSKYFYDDKGSDLFVQITKSKDYYPTNAEKNIFENKKSKIISHFKKNSEVLHLIELGAGDGHKTKLLVDEFIKNSIEIEYNPIDISENAVEGISKKFNDANIKTFGIVGEYIPALKWAYKNKTGRKLILFLGSNIGNFSICDSLVFLQTIWKNLTHDDHILIGFDLKKDINVLLSAYNDEEGITSKFNLNLLTRINKELGANFNIEDFQHFGTYNPNIGGMESYLISKKKQKVKIDYLEKEFEFSEYEPIHLEYSFKYLKEDIEYLARETGFEIVENFIDESGLFVDSLWRVKKK